jgi:hypothetical protein
MRDYHTEIRQAKLLKQQSRDVEQFRLAMLAMLATGAVMFGALIWIG